MASEKECLHLTEEGFFQHAGQKGEKNLLYQLSLNSKDNFNSYIILLGASNEAPFFIQVTKELLLILQIYFNL